MSDTELTGDETPEQVRRHLELRGFTRDQARAMQQATTQLAHAQVRRAASVTSSFVTTVVALISSAFGFVAALAWNNAIQAWINQTYSLGKTPDWRALVVYALAATALAIVVIAVLGLINARLKGGRNLLDKPSN